MELRVCLSLVLFFLPVRYGANSSSSSSSSTTPEYSNQIAVRIDGGPERAREIAKRHACEFIGQIGSLQDHYLFEHAAIAKRSLEESSPAHQRLRDDPEILWFEQQVKLKRVKRDGSAINNADFDSIIRSGGKTKYAFRDPWYPQQWYLHKGGHGGFDMNVEKAWRRGYSGKGISVSILDDGVQPNHPDLAQNYDPLASLDINGNDDDPTPTDDGNNKHGTRCAGEVAAVAGNDICGVGVAFNASIGGVRMLDGDVHDSVEAKALSLNPQHIHIYSASWGPNDDGMTVDGPGPLAKKAFAEGIRAGRGGLGSVYVWASGNGGKSADSCSCDGYTNSIWTISVSSAAQDGSRPWYLEECPSTLATTYSSGSAMQPSIVTTDLNMQGNGMRACTNKHTGTSASAPLAAGIIALALEANPKLNWRDLQYLTILSARPEPLADGAWTVNGVGRKVSNQFGYGLMDADKLVQLAEKWITVPDQHICHSQQFSQQMNILNGRLSLEISTDGCQSSANSILFLEHVQVVLSISAAHRGSLVISLTSPAGTKSTMLPPRPLDGNRQGFTLWPFMSVQSWGENPAGIWRVEIEDKSVNRQIPNAYNSHLSAWSLVMHGTATDPLARQPKISPSSDRAGSSISSAEAALINAAVNCHLSCATCHGPRFDDCGSCFSGYFFHNSQCLLACPHGFLPLNDTMTCSICSSKCTQCLDSSHCLSCQPGHRLENDQCVALHGTVNDECSHGFYFDHRLTQCTACRADCEQCAGSSAKDAHCLVCRPPKILSDGLCVDFCPPDASVINGTCISQHHHRVAADGVTSSRYFLTATVACIVILSIGFAVFCCLQMMSKTSYGKRSGTGKTMNGRKFPGGIKYEKAPVRLMENADDDDDSDEEVETFSRRRLADALPI